MLITFLINPQGNRISNPHLFLTKDRHTEQCIACDSEKPCHRRHRRASHRDHAIGVPLDSGHNTPETYPNRDANDTAP